MCRSTVGPRRLVIAISVACLSPGLAVAEPPPTDNSEQISEIVVTATKRSEPLQKVAEAVSAITAEGLQEMGATSFVDYARTIPSLSFSDSGAGRQSVTIRGIGPGLSADGVGFYIGETPIVSNGYAAAVVNPDLVDLDHIEVLRGPQGTLYGGESIGGTIKLVPRTPNLTKMEGEVHGAALVTEGASGAAPGGYGDLTLNVPVVGGIAAIRGSIWTKDTDGDFNRTYGYVGDFSTSASHPVGIVKDVAAERTWGFHGAVLVQPIDKLNITASILQQDQRFNGLNDITGGDTNPDNRLVQNFISNFEEPQRNQFSLYSLTADYGCGNFNIVSNSSYSQTRSEIAEEGTSLLQFFIPLIVPGDIPPAFPNGPEVIYSNYSFTHETRIATTESIFGFDAVGGVFYSRLRGSWHFLYSPPDYNQLVTGNDPTNPIYAPDNNLFYGDQRTFQNETAEFGEVTYHVTKSLSVTAGLRHYVVTNGGDTLNTGILSTPSLDIVHSSTSGFAHKGNVSYQLTDNHLVYFQYSEGYRPGRGNLPPPPQCGDVSVPSQIQPDAIKEFELGTKTAWFDKRLTVNAAVYRIDWKNIQQSGFIPACGFGYADNFGAARIKGVELEVNDRLTSHVSAGFSGSFTQGRLQQDLPVVQGIPNAIRGDQVLGVPIWQYAAFGKATYPILQGDDGYTRLDWQYTGSSWANYNRLADGSRDPLSQLQVTRLLNLRTGMTYRSCDFSLSATNLLNMIARQSIDANGSVTTQIPGRPRYVVNRPRTFLIDAVYKF